MSLRLSSVRKSFASRSSTLQVLSDISFEVAQGECVAIVGASGVGKSTLISLIAGYLTPDAGTIQYCGRAVTGPGPDRVVVSQADSLMPWMTVGRNAEYSALVGHERSNRTATKQTAVDLLKRFGLWQQRDRYPRSLSGGQRRRVELIRAFAAGASVFLLDEPYTGLDETLRTELGLYLLEWRTVSPVLSTVLVTHDLQDACFLADRVLFLGGEPASILIEKNIVYGQKRRAELLMSEEFAAVLCDVRETYRRTDMARETQ